MTVKVLKTRSKTLIPNYALKFAKKRKKCVNYKTSYALQFQRYSKPKNCYVKFRPFKNLYLLQVFVIDDFKYGN